MIIATAAPVAVAANVIRISVTSFMHEFVSAHWADLVFHDLAGWLMMPLALGMLWLEMCILDRLFVDVPVPQRSTPFGIPTPAARVPGPIPVRLTDGVR